MEPRVTSRVVCFICFWVIDTEFVNHHLHRLWCILLCIQSLFLHFRSLRLDSVSNRLCNPSIPFLTILAIVCFCALITYSLFSIIFHPTACFHPDSMKSPNKALLLLHPTALAFECWHQQILDAFSIHGKTLYWLVNRYKWIIINYKLATPGCIWKTYPVCRRLSFPGLW